METQTLINGAGAVIFFLLGVIVQSLRTSMKQMQDTDALLADKVQKIEVLVAGTYVKRDDLSKLTDALFAKLDKIENKVDMKLNRDECPGINGKSC